jgi:hypothetical protein
MKQLFLVLGLFASLLTAQQGNREARPARPDMGPRAEMPQRLEHRLRALADRLDALQQRLAERLEDHPTDRRRQADQGQDRRPDRPLESERRRRLPPPQAEGPRGANRGRMDRARWLRGEPGPRQLRAGKPQRRHARDEHRPQPPRAQRRPLPLRDHRRGHEV